MTRYGLVAAIVWAAVAAFFVLRVDAFARRWLDRVKPLQVDPSAIEIPDDLAALALGETEKWAQDSVIEAIRERYVKFGDWNKVRAAMGVGART